MTRLRHALVGLLAVALLAGAVGLTGAVLTGKVRSKVTTAYAEFVNCGQGLREGGDVKLRGVLMGRIGTISRDDQGNCRVTLDIEPSKVEQIPRNVGAQIRAKTIFGEKWVELLYPEEPASDRIAAGDVIGRDRTIDPLEVETILNVALPLLDAIDPEHLAGALEALAGGFVGHEDAVIRGVEDGIEALRPLNEDEALFREGLDQLEAASAVFENVDDDLLDALESLDEFQKFNVENEDLLTESLNKAPTLLRELSTLFEVRFVDLTTIVDRGATVVGVLAARTEDLDRLIDALPQFNSAWIRNLDHTCRYRQQTDEPGKSPGDPVPGRCWRVHNLLSESQGAYAPGEGPGPRQAPSTLGDLLQAPDAVQGGTR